MTSYSDSCWKETSVCAILDAALRELDTVLRMFTDFCTLDTAFVHVVRLLRTLDTGFSNDVSLLRTYTDLVFTLLFLLEQ